MECPFFKEELARGLALVFHLAFASPWDSAINN